MKKSAFNIIKSNGETACLHEGECVYINCYYDFVAVVKGVHDEGENKYLEAYAIYDAQDMVISNCNNVCTLEEIVEVRPATTEEEKALLSALRRSGAGERLKLVENLIGKKQ